MYLVVCSCFKILPPERIELSTLDKTSALTTELWMREFDGYSININPVKLIPIDHSQRLICPSPFLKKLVQFMITRDDFQTDSCGCSPNFPLGELRANSSLDIFFYSLMNSIKINEPSYWGD